MWTFSVDNCVPISLEPTVGRVIHTMVIILFVGDINHWRSCCSGWQSVMLNITCSSHSNAVLCTFYSQWILLKVSDVTALHFLLWLIVVISFTSNSMFLCLNPTPFVVILSKFQVGCQCWVWQVIFRVCKAYEYRYLNNTLWYLSLSHLVQNGWRVFSTSNHRSVLHSLCPRTK